MYHAQAMLQWKRQARAAPGVASFVATRQREQELFELGYQRVAGESVVKEHSYTCTVFHVFKPSGGTGAFVETFRRMSLSPDRCCR